MISKALAKQLRRKITIARHSHEAAVSAGAAYPKDAEAIREQARSDEKALQSFIDWITEKGGTNAAKAQ